MNRRQHFLFGLLLLSLPIAVAFFEWPVLAAIALAILALVIRQAMQMATLIRKPDGPDLELETILPSHFAEKGRWCLDRLGVDYTEKRMGGLIGVFFTGRTVPMLTVQTGHTRSAICESSHILRYLYGRFSGQPDVDADFLEPTQERRDWEHRLDQYGVYQQVWIYHHLLKDPALCKEAWGAHSQRLPLWQRWTILVMYPFFEMLIRRGFKPTRDHYNRVVENTEALFADTESLLADGRKALLGGDTVDFVDITLASLSALWVQPENFARGDWLADRPDPDRFPPGMKDDIQRWRATYPATTAHIERLYREER